MGTLYIVATPIGNLEDITLRAVRILQSVDLIAAEDTRTTGRLLQRYQIETPQISFHEYSDTHKLQQIVERLANADIALVSDAGTPGVSDPGFRLINAVLEAGHTVTPLPGPNAAIAALVASGLPSDRFLFLGFVPRGKAARQAALLAVAELPYTLILYESPNRLGKLLAAALATLGDRQLCIARELTKRYEELFRGSVSAAQTHFAERVRGEITVVIAGSEPQQERWSAGEVRAALQTRLADGVKRKAAAAAVAKAAGWRAKEVYNLDL